jgi:deoxyxylulose-5-phosphate synthase
MYLKFEDKIPDNYYPENYRIEDITKEMNYRFARALTDKIMENPPIENCDHNTREVKGEVIVVKKPKDFFENIGLLYESRYAGNSTERFVELVREYLEKEEI